MHRVIPVVCATLMLAGVACGSLPPAAGITPSPNAPSQAPTLPPAATTLTATPTQPSSPAPATPTVSGVSPWPLPADLFYLTDKGQVFRQPAAGDASAAAPVTPSGEAVSDFAVAPGGEWLLVRAGGTITALSLDGQTRQVIASATGTPPDVARGRTLTWSPDAARLVYTTDQGFQIYVPGGGESFQPLIFGISTPDTFVVDLRWSLDSRRVVAWSDNRSAILCDTGNPSLLQCSDLGRVNGAAWLIDGRLAFAPAEGGLALLNPDDPNSRAFMVPQDRQVSLPFQRDDGTLAFFVHEGDITTPGVLNAGNPADLTYQPASQTALATAGFSWDVSGKWLAAGVPAVGGIGLYDPASGASASITAAGTVKSLAWGDRPPRGVTNLPLPATLYFLAPQSGVTQVWRLPASGDLPEPITSAPADVTAYDISHDGSKVTYTSGGGIFVQTIGAADALQIALLAPDAHSPSGTPSFSPTGRRVAYANNGIWVYDTTANDVVRLAPDSPPGTPQDRIKNYDHPLWSPDGKWLLVKVSFFQGHDFAVMPSGGNDISVATLNQFNAQAEWAADSTIFVYSDGSSSGQPQVSRLQPFRVRSPQKLASAPVVDVQERPDGRLALLRSPSPFPFGPTSVRIFSVKPDGSDLQAETGSIVVEQPLLSPDAVLVAGLAQTQRLADGTVAGQLIVVNPATKQIFVVEGMTSVYDLLWGK